MTIRILTALALAVSISGCTSYAGFGAGPGSPNYFACVQQQQAIDAQDRAGWAGVTAAGATLMRPPTPVYMYGR